MLLRWIVVLSLSLGSSFGFASEHFWSRSTDETRFYVLYGQDSIWRIDHFSEDEEGFIDLMQRQSFRSYTKASESFKKLRARVDVSIQESSSAKNDRLKKGFLWTAVNKWSWDWEVKYAQWVRANVNPQFFADHDLPADCADAAYAFRWIFARIHKLPVANRLANGKWLTHESYRQSWSHLPTHEDWRKDVRFRKAINALLDSTYTHTLMQDSYPVAINTDSFIEGIHHLALHSTSGHTQIVNEVNSNSSHKVPLLLISATVPRDLANLSVNGFWDGNLPAEGQSGFFRMLWVEKKSGRWRPVKKEKIPYYSTEQYKQAFLGGETSFAMALLKKIAPGFDPMVIYRNGVDLITSGIAQRVQVVKDGYAFCSSNDCSEGTANYENWSTPSRDGRLYKNLKEFESFVENIVSLTAQPLLRWTEALEDQTIGDGFGRNVSLRLWRTIWLAKAYSSQPWEPIEKRWAFTAESFATQLAEKLKAFWVQRQQKIDNNPCLTRRCTEGGKEWRLWSTHSLDNEMKRLFLNAAYFCNNSGRSTCLNFQDQLRQLSLQGDSVSSHLVKTQFYNSSANVSNDERWGLNSGVSDIELFYNTSYLKENKNGLVAIHANGRSELRRGDRVLHTFAKNFEIIHFFENDSLLLKDEQSQTYKVFHQKQWMDTGVSLHKKFVFLNNQAFSVGGNLFFHRGGQWIVGGALPGARFIASGNKVGASLLFFRNQHLFLWFFDRGQGVEVPVLRLQENQEQLLYVKVVDESVSHSIIQVNDGMSGPSQFYLVDRKSKIVSPYTLKQSFHGRLQKQVWILADADGHRAVQLDAEFQPAQSKDLGNFQSYHAGEPAQVVVIENKSYFLLKHQEGLQFEKTELQAPASAHLMGITPNHYIVGYAKGESDYKSALYDVDTHTEQWSGLWAFPSQALNGEVFTILDDSFVRQWQFLWKGKDRWVRYTPLTVMATDLSGSFLDAVDGATNYGQVVVSQDAGYEGQEKKLLTSPLFYLPGGIALVPRE